MLSCMDINLPKDFMKSIRIPLAKNKSVTLDANVYRLFALATVAVIFKNNCEIILM